MDKSWMNKSRLSKDFELGVAKFIEYGFSNTTNTSIRCPCLKCVNCEKHSRNVIRDHLYVNGIDESYKIWFCHGEELPSSTVHREYSKSDNHMYEENDIGGVKEMIKVAHEEYAKDPNEFEKLLNDAEKPLYKGCKKFTKLSTLVKLYNLKVRFGWSDISFSELLKIFKEILPATNELPSSLYEAKKTLGALGMDYEKIHACPNDCCLYRKEYASENTCPECGESRWKSDGNKKKRQKEIPAKVIWYFPPIPRFKKMYRTLDCAKNLTWHSDDRVVDGKLRHPADSPAWKLVDFKWPDFGSEHRNLRLALSADGINPHGNMSSKYSCWPVVMIIYNLPPWLCMKRKFMMLSMLISGPKQPGDDIGIYLAPLLEDLKLLWESGVQCYDAYRDELFNLRAVLLWTINDFPAYGNLSGCSVKGYKACPICEDNTSSIRLKHGKKMAYLGHRKFLACNHIFRRQKKSFNGQKELGTIPEPFSGVEVFAKAKDLKFQVGKKKKKRQLKKGSTKSCWNRLSAFFELPYWKHLHVRHCLDVMHIEKNVCMNILGTLLDIPGKSKDGLSARLDLDDLKIRPELAPISGDKKTFIPPTCYTLTREEKRCVLRTLSNVKVPQGYSSNIKNVVSMDDLKLNSLKSHDCHVLLQQLLPIAIRSVLPKYVRYVLTRLCIFFNSICNKVIDVIQLEKLQEDIVVTLCLLEKYFPPSFFTIMMHLTVHLVREIKLCGPVYLRWMYPFERFMKVIKNSVRNRYRPEGCIAESYILEEAVEFCSEFLSGVVPIGLGSQKLRERSENSNVGKPLSSGVLFRPEPELLYEAHRYVLENTIDVQPYIEKHMSVLQSQQPYRSKNQKWVQDEHNRGFISWLRETVAAELEKGDTKVSDNLRWIAHGPHPNVTKYNGYIINGCQYQTKSCDNVRSVQNSGVSLVAKTMQVCSSKDKNPIIGDMSFYGVIQEIWELNYNTFQVAMFKCDWIENNNGIKTDELGFLLVDLNRIGHKSDSFILATQARQVFYVEDPSDVKWSIVLTPPQREFEDQYYDDEIGDTVLNCQGMPNNMPNIESTNDLDENISTYVRVDCEGIWIPK